MPPDLHRVSITSHSTCVTGHTPRIGEINHENPDENDSSPSRRRIIFPSPAITADDPRDDEVTHSHANRARYENIPSAELVYPEHGGNGEEEFDDADDAGGEKGRFVAVKADSLEDHGAGLFVSGDCD